MSDKTLEYYLNLPYTIEFKKDPSDPDKPVWFAEVKELSGCMTEADTLQDVTALIEDAMGVWIQGSLDANLPIPEPRPEQEYSGKFSLRLPKSLHRDLVQVAEREGVSLNQYINMALSRVVGTI